MARIPNQVIDDLRSKVKIEDVVSQYVDLKKQGQGYTCSCPFHEDKNPSFSIHTEKQIYKCFSCGRAGNVFGFIQEIEQVGFIEAVRKVAEMTGNPLDPAYFESDERERPEDLKTKQVFQLHQKIQDFYQYYLRSTQNGQEALQYLLNRGMTEESLDKFALGLAPANSELVLAYLQQDNFSMDVLIDSGIFYWNEEQGKLIDRFRDRIIFPLRDSKGRTVAFSGRLYQANDSRKGKYVNSSESSIFSKSKLLYNLDQARVAIRRQQQVLICEGYMDVISLVQAGFEQVVASMGTSLTQDQLSHLCRLAEEIIFVFDGDEAGSHASERALELSHAFPNHQFKIIQIPMNMDPDDWIRQKGSQSFQQLINTAQSTVSFQKERLKQSYNLQDQQGIATYIDEVLKLIRQLPSPIEQQLYLSDLAQEFQLSVDLLEEQLMRLPKAEGHRTEKVHQVRDSKDLSLKDPTVAQGDYLAAVQSHRAYQAEKLLLACLIFYPQAWEDFEKLESVPSLYHGFSQEALLQVIDYYYQGHQLPLTGVNDLVRDANAQQLLASIIWDFEPLGYHSQIMIDALKSIEIAFKELQIKELEGLLRESMLNQDQEKMQKLIRQIMLLHRELKS